MSKIEVIPSSCSGQRVDKVLATLFPDYSRSKLKEWLKKGAIRINNQVYAPDAKVKGDEEVILSADIENDPQTELQAQDIPLDIVFEDEQIIIINKPAGLIVHPGAGNPDGTLVNALLHHNKSQINLPRAGIIHRLDKDTSGLLVVAKTLKAHTHLVQEMQNRTIKRHYVALVYGHIIAGKTIQTGYGRDPRNRLKMAVTNASREAITQFTIAKHYDFATLLNVELMTGRTHQIRVHMAYIKHSIIGDKLYRSQIGLGKNVPENIREIVRAFPRQALHAYKLAFVHPTTQEIVSFEQNIPSDFEELITILDKSCNT